MTPINAKDVAARTGMSLRSVHRKAADGILPTVAKMPGTTGSFVFDADAIDAWIAAQSVAAS